MICRNCKRLREFEQIEISRQAVEVTVNSKEEKLYMPLFGFCTRN
jgi:hypothetical protein